MASGSAGESGAPVLTSGVPDEVPNMRDTMERMVASITSLQTQMASLMEDPFTHQGDIGPAIRARAYDHEIQRDRGRMIQKRRSNSSLVA